MGHIAILAQPIGWLHFFSCMVKHLSGRFHLHGLRIKYFLCYQHLAVFVVWLLAIVNKEVDTGGEEVDG